MTTFIHSIKTICCCLFLCIAVQAVSQTIAETKNIELTFNKTSSLIFPAGITAVDRGSRDILAQRIKGVENVLQLKAGAVEFMETNLTVITKDGRLHHFIVRYSEQPGQLAIPVDAKTDAIAPVQFTTEMTEGSMTEYAKRVIASSKKSKIAGTSKFDMKLALQGIYIQDDVLFYHLRLSNHSNIPFHTDVIRFYVKDKQKSKRTASQEVVEYPLYQYGEAHYVEGRSTHDLVFALPKFTIPDAKFLNIQVMEKKGGRHLHLKIKNRTIVNAKLISAR